MALSDHDMNWDALYNYYYKRVLGYFRKRIMNEEIAEDLTQEVFKLMFRFFRKYEGIQPFEAYMFRTAKSVFVKHIKKVSNSQNLHEETESNHTDPDPSDEYQSEDIGVEASVIEALNIDCLLSIIADLTANEQYLLVLICTTQYNRDEIGEILGPISANTVNVRLSRLTEKLRRLFKEKCY